MALAVAIEVRTINNRFFKLSIRGEGYGALEPRIEEIVRQSIRRGTVQMNLRVDRVRSPESFRINPDVLGGYRTQIQALYRQWDVNSPIPLESLLPLPGVVEDHSATAFEPEDDWPVIRATLEAAMGNLAHMRTDEGRAMASDLALNCRAIAAGWTRSSAGRRWWRRAIAAASKNVSRRC